VLVPDRPLNDFIQMVGLTAQVSATILIAALFAMLRRPGQRRSYFHFWRLAWVCLALALLLLTPQVMAAAGAQYPFSYGPYQIGKLLFLLFLFSGVLAYARGFDRRLVWRVGLPATVAYGAASILLSGSFIQAMGWQVPVVLLVYAGATALLLGLPRARRTLGSRLTGSATLLAAGLWLANAIHTFAPAGGYAAGPRFWLGFFASRYGSFADLLLQVLMGFGMVVLLFEDTGRETTEAYKQLAISHRHLERAAYIDPLTGALTRRAFEEGVGLEMAAVNYGTVAMLDLDDLKSVNDNWGHETGDGLLRHAVEALRVRLRPLDQVYRWGGDEFTVLMVQATLAEAVARLEGLLADIPAYAATAMPAIAVRVSHGAAFFRSAAGLRQAVAEADQAMLEDKRRRKGSGRVTAGETS
jgi:diguanylate cyclase (GGDEF)-like protein